MLSFVRTLATFAWVTVTGRVQSDSFLAYAEQEAGQLGVAGGVR